MILLALTLSLASDCERNLREQAFYSPTVIAKAIERFEDPLEQRIFSAIVRSFDYDVIARHFRITLPTVLDIGLRGGAFLTQEKDIEDAQKIKHNTEP